MFGASSRTILKRAAFITTAGGGSALYFSDRLPNHDDDSSVVVPTIQALARVCRLTGTCTLMAKDYYWRPPAFATHESDSSGSNDASVEEQQRSESDLEDQIRTAERRLEDTQLAYASFSAEARKLKVQDRLDLKQNEKQAMMDAANDLAVLEEQWERLGRTTSLSAAHTSAAQRLLALCHANGGVYIKVGQHLANLDYLLPQEYIETLAALYDDNPVTSYADVCAVIFQDLGQHPSELFDTFNAVPIASASLAQVHVAYKDGVKLAVKVQHRGLRETSRGDIFSLVSAVRLAEKLFTDFQFGWLADEIAPNLPKELDFRHEGRNAERASEHMQTTGLNCIIPRILWSQTSERVLTMEFEEGFKVTDTAKIRECGLSTKDVATLVSSVFASQVFESGHVHCDPHEANVLLRKDAKTGRPLVILVDHGLYKQLDPTFQRHYALLWKSLMLADLEGIKSASSAMGIVGTDSYSLFAGVLTARPFDEIVDRSKRKIMIPGQKSAATGDATSSKSDEAIIRSYAKRYLPNILELLNRIPRQMLLLLKMNDCLRHIDYSLGSPANTLLVTGRYAAKAVYRHDGTEYGRAGAAIATRPSWRHRLCSWWSYFHVDVRIQMHELGVWWLQKTKRI